MTPLIDALKGLLENMREYGASDENNLDRAIATSKWAYEVRSIIAEHERSETDATVKCRCGNPAEADHTCPFKSETNDSDDLCNCCDSCRHECAMDI